MFKICKVIILGILALFSKDSFSQLQSSQSTGDTLLFFECSDTPHKNRIRTLLWGGGAAYSAVLIGLNEAWYKDYDRSGFHFFDDGGEWKGMDKLGHIHTTYFESEWIYGLSRWAGLPENQSIWLGVGTASFFQLTVEMLDAHSAEWGFSWRDVAANSLGAGLFAVQQSIWHEQKIRMKYSVHPVSHSKHPIISADGISASSAEKRAEDIFGTGFAERLLKDYNGHTYWLSTNPASFSKPGDFQFWHAVNVAVGVSAENIYGASSNAWNENGDAFWINEPRAHQLFLSLDLDLSRIRTKKAWVRTLLKTLNVIKIPFPALEYSTSGTWKFHSIYF